MQTLLNAQIFVSSFSQTFINGEMFVYFLADIDECSVDSGICSNGYCENVMGSYECVCLEGYTQSSDKISCEGTICVR